MKKRLLTSSSFVEFSQHGFAQARALPSQTSLRSRSSSSYSHASLWEHPSRWNNQSVPISTSSAGSHSQSPHWNGSPLPLNPVHLFPGAPPVVYLDDDLGHLQSEGKPPKARDHGILISLFGTYNVAVV